jgi:Do/DeqQ family serine protease
MVPLDFRGAAKNVMPSVVHIASMQTFTNNPSGGNYQDVPPQFRDFFDQFFEQAPQGQRGGDPHARMGSGSGVIINADGYIVTNNHVIKGADEIEVTLNDNRTFDATVIGTDPTTDLALIKIEGNELPYLALANSDQVEVGEWVLAVGNPFNLNSTVTAGIVSAKARNIRILKDKSAIESFIQTDAAINPGNSGGALVDLSGNLIGINTAIASPTGSYSGYGFAVPVNIVDKVINDLMEFGTVQRGFLGIMIRSLDGNLAKENDLDITEGVFVDKVMDESAADEAGLEPGDVVIKIDGAKVKSSPELQELVGRKRPGDNVDVVVLRDGEEKSFLVTLFNKDGNEDIVKKESKKLDELLGANFEDVDKKVSKRLGISGGVKITALRTGKLKRQTDISEGFIITKVNGNQVTDVKSLEDELAKVEGGVMLEGYYESTGSKHYYAFGM